jgi:hypothetical protein
LEHLSKKLFGGLIEETMGELFGGLIEETFWRSYRRNASAMTGKEQLGISLINKISNGSIDT